MKPRKNEVWMVETCGENETSSSNFLILLRFDCSVNSLVCGYIIDAPIHSAHYIGKPGWFAVDGLVCRVRGAE